ncbi:hypothetical protein ACFW6V_32910 [Streptomyces sp. NPDC058734]|uniref:hypothetical protein n=1 Tax=Streptomyces sp. NPDC058734 TaxID=3346615 RepID=UPI0036A6C788
MFALPQTAGVFVTSPYGSVFNLFGDTFGKCASCQSEHPLWPERRHHLDWDGTGLDPDAVRVALEVLAAAADGSPDCNIRLLTIQVWSVYEAMAGMRMGPLARRSYRRRRQSGQDPMLAQETILYAVFAMTLHWSFQYADRSSESPAKVLEHVTDTANAAAASLPDLHRRAAESMLVSAVQNAAGHGDGLDGLFSALGLSCRMLEKLSMRLPGDRNSNQVGILLAAANYAVCAGTLLRN